MSSVKYSSITINKCGEVSIKLVKMFKKQAFEEFLAVKEHYENRSKQRKRSINDNLNIQLKQNSNFLFPEHWNNEI